ncbi:bifunctional protein-serine/threonine kinase/phosphatase [Steroidobacter sp. S1-65]|uniref:Bifunctional protein-serine/threonine kinase/phosphatase n=1 Tax=Steroidobacter gossypii TaxID=2805490 RepID=A0ABS1X2C3_9GAMM|nr:bifunctional protein-serine/threonine kinase/phosphatase [Steroidobacter gossypii]MBM0107373.1 bifunctional protein-serine/threonine kinase/phosphatase [Steroidobacter gossypii]
MNEAVPAVQVSGPEQHPSATGLPPPPQRSAAPDVGLRVGIGSCTHQGGRARNEDFAACYIAEQTRQPALGVVAALADGMGGAKGGRTAAEIAVRGFIEGCVGQPITVGVPRISARSADAVNRWIHSMGRSDPNLNGMACTLSALVLCGRRAHLLHLGDSRIYRLRDRELSLLTTDHTLGAPGTSSVLTRAMGVEDRLCADHAIDGLQVHDRYLICSDGVHGRLSHAEILATLAMRAAPEETAIQLVEQAVSNSGADNATALVLDVLSLPETQIADLEIAHSTWPLRNAPNTGEIIDDYELGELLADGPYMRVFRATDRREHRRVIMKFPKPRPGLDAVLRSALLRELWIASHVRSPFVTEVLEPTDERRTCFYGVLPYYEGETLERRLLRRPQMPLAAGLEVSIKLTKALATLHRAGIVHRDVKPENVILETNGGLKLIDLGVARLRQFDEPESFESPGTRSYMAPELFTGAQAEESSDIFALGVTIYRMFSGGAYPYGEVEAFAHPRFGSPTPLSKHRPDLPAWLDHCLARAFAVDRRDRYADAVEFAFELEHGSLRAVPQSLAKLSLYERNPVRFWQMVSSILLIALLVALAHI